MADDSGDNHQLDDQLKSIVYGDVVRNKHGVFRCFCATVSKEEQIESIVSYLRKNVSFHRLNKFSYAYRISYSYEAKDEVVESYYNDARLEGCGEKILHLLQKFNVENVLLVIGIDKKESFGILSPDYYHTIVERAKDLLSTLYERVVESDLKKVPNNNSNVFLTQAELPDNQSKVKSKSVKVHYRTNVQTVNFENIPQAKKSFKIGRPNHFLSPEQKQMMQVQAQIHQTAPIRHREKLLQSVLRNNLKRNHEKLDHVLREWQENDFQHLKFICLYDKNPRVKKVFKMLMVLENVQTFEDLGQNYDFKERLPQLSGTSIVKQRCKVVMDMLRQDKNLTVKALEKENHVVAALLDYLSLLVKNHELEQTITTLNDREKSVEEEQPSYDLNRSRDRFKLDDDIAVDMTKDFANSLRDTRSQREQNLNNSQSQGSEVNNESYIMQNSASARAANKNSNSKSFVSNLKSEVKAASSKGHSKTQSNQSEIRSPNSSQPIPKSPNQQAININDEYKAGQKRSPANKTPKKSHEKSPISPLKELNDNNTNTFSSAVSPHSKIESARSPSERGEKPRLIGQHNDNRSPINGGTSVRTGSVEKNDSKIFDNMNITGGLKSVERTKSKTEIVENDDYTGWTQRQENADGDSMRNANIAQIPQDPEELMKYLAENNVDKLTKEGLEVIADRLEDHRSKNY